MHALGRLITERMEHPDHRWSYREVERRAHANKQRLSKSTVEKLRSKMTPQISYSTIRGLAAGLGVTELTVANAALQSWGINPHPVEVTDTMATLRVDPSLSDRDRRRLAVLIREMRGEPDHVPVTSELIGQIRSLVSELRSRVPGMDAIIDKPEDWTEDFFEGVSDEPPPVRRGEDGENGDKLGRP